jgi:hypothetical protein
MILRFSGKAPKKLTFAILVIAKTRDYTRKELVLDFVLLLNN